MNILRLTKRSVPLIFSAGHLCVPYRFAHLSPTESPHPPVKAVVIKASLFAPPGYLVNGQEVDEGALTLHSALWLAIDNLFQ